MDDIFQSERIYHIYNRAIGDDNLFKNDQNYIYFLQKYQFYLGDKFETLAYCLIPNHFHFLVRIMHGVENESIVKSFSDFQNSYAKSLNKAFERSGALFQRKFKRKEVGFEDYFSRLILYIHSNPVKHQLVSDIHEWKYSSYRSYLCQKPTKINRELVLEWFGGRDKFEEFHHLNAGLYLPPEIILEK